MKVSGRELGLIGLVLQITPKGEYRTFNVTELEKATNMWKKISVLTEGEADKKQYIDSELEMNTDEKVFVRGLLNEHLWGVADGEVVQELIKKLS